MLKHWSSCALLLQVEVTKILYNSYEHIWISSFSSASLLMPHLPGLNASNVSFGPGLSNAVKKAVGVAKHHGPWPFAQKARCTQGIWRRCSNSHGCYCLCEEVPCSISSLKQIKSFNTNGIKSFTNEVLDRVSTCFNQVTRAAWTQASCAAQSKHSTKNNVFNYILVDRATINMVQNSQKESWIAWSYIELLSMQDCKIVNGLRAPLSSGKTWA